MKLTLTALLMASAVVRAWEFDYYCPDALAHPVHYGGSNNRGCTTFSTPCVPQDTINWNTNLADGGCKLRVYNDDTCTTQAKSWGFSDFYGDIGVYAKKWKITGC